MELSPEDKKKLLRRLSSNFNLLMLIFWLCIGFYILVEIDSPILDDDYWAVEVEQSSQPEVDPMKDSVANGIHVLSGLKAEGDYKLIISYCGRCHDYDLVTQNRATKDGWLEIIRWMQATQELQDLGEHEEPILNYLAQFYGPETAKNAIEQRRKPLDQNAIEWYELEE